MTEMVDNLSHYCKHTVNMLTYLRHIRISDFKFGNRNIKNKGLEVRSVMLLWAAGGEILALTGSTPGGQRTNTGIYSLSLARFQEC